MDTLAEATQGRRFSFKKKLKIWLVSSLFFAVFRALFATLRFQCPHASKRAKAEQLKDGRFILASWHQNTLLGMMAHRHQNIKVMISNSSDGAIIASITERFGMGTVRGSSSRDGKEALLQLAQHIRTGGRAALTVDGPRGPLHQVKMGVIKLAQETGIPILPVCVVSNRFWRMHRSWDRFRIPKPFSKVTILYGEPLLVAEDAADLDLHRKALEQALKSLDTAPSQS